MPTFTYNWANAEVSFYVNDTVISGDQSLPAITSTNGGASYFTAYYDGSGAVWGQGFSNTTAEASDEVLVNGETLNVQTDASMDQLIRQNFIAPPGAIAVTYTDYSVDAGGDIRVRLISAGPGFFSGSAYGTLLSDVGVSTTTSDDTDSDVAALNDGGFVVTWTRDFGAGDLDVDGAIMIGGSSSRMAVSAASSSPGRFRK